MPTTLHHDGFAYICFSLQRSRRIMHTAQQFARVFVNSKSSYACVTWCACANCILRRLKVPVISAIGTFACLPYQNVCSLFYIRKNGCRLRKSLNPRIKIHNRSRNERIFKKVFRSIVFANVVRNIAKNNIIHSYTCVSCVCVKIHWMSSLSMAEQRAFISLSQFHNLTLIGDQFHSLNPHRNDNPHQDHICASRCHIHI